MTRRTNAGAIVIAFLSTVLVLAPIPARAETIVTAYSAGMKVVGAGTNTWGTAAGAPYANVWTEVELSSGWSRSQRPGSPTVPGTSSFP
ncbi:hypothetical protein TLA_TLA_01287 [Tessaracoccus lapidicaptus]|nr:hypothetical protein TLA_TLA_01287 [Tessaracoccus lapidicaptus]